VSGGAVAPGRNAGFIVFSADASGILATWYLADFTLDPSEPVNPRVVHANAPGYAAYPTAAMSDGDGGALLVFHDGLSYENSKVAKMRHVFRSGVLDAVGPPRVSGLALSLAPNPARTELTLDLALAMDGPARIELLDVSGRRLLSRAIASGPGARRERLELPVGLAPGVYVARLTQGLAARERRFAVVR